MSDIDNSGPAFPCDSKRFEAEGMTLRDYFAAKAMSAFIQTTQNNECSFEEGSELAAYAAYRMADAMLNARKK